jgi:hypothetical protein
MRAIATIAKPHRGHGPLLQVANPTRTIRIPCSGFALRVEWIHRYVAHPAGALRASVAQLRRARLNLVKKAANPTTCLNYPRDWCRQATNRIRNSIGEATPSSRAPSVASRASALFGLNRGGSQGPLNLPQNLLANSSQSPSPMTP